MIFELLILFIEVGLELLEVRFHLGPVLLHSGPEGILLVLPELGPGFLLQLLLHGLGFFHLRRHLGRVQPGHLGLEFDEMHVHGKRVFLRHQGDEAGLALFQGGGRLLDVGGVLGRVRAVHRHAHQRPAGIAQQHAQRPAQNAHQGAQQAAAQGVVAGLHAGIEAVLQLEPAFLLLDHAGLGDHVILGDRLPF